MESFRDRVAAVTGGDLGIGSAPARAFMRERARVRMADVEEFAATQVIEGRRFQPLELAIHR